MGLAKQEAVERAAGHGDGDLLERPVELEPVVRGQCLGGEDEPFLAVVQRGQHTRIGDGCQRSDDPGGDESTAQ